jgi:hypothetical protein
MWVDFKIPYEKKSTSPASWLVVLCLLLVIIMFWFHR